MRSKNRVIFVQGYGDYSDGKWPVWLKRELVKNGWDFIMVDMPDPLFPEVGAWVKALKDLKITINENTFFVGHSLGCITIARFLETLPGNKKVGGCAFVAGFCSFPSTPLISDFCVRPLDWEKVKEKANQSFVVLSDDDKMVPLDLGLEFANKMEADVVLEKGKGHFKSNVDKIPSLLSSILEMAQMTEEMAEIKKLKGSRR